MSWSTSNGMKNDIQFCWAWSCWMMVCVCTRIHSLCLEIDGNSCLSMRANGNQNRHTHRSDRNRQKDERRQWQNNGRKKNRKIICTKMKKVRKKSTTSYVTFSSRYVYLVQYTHTHTLHTLRKSYFKSNSFHAKAIKKK